MKIFLQIVSFAKDRHELYCLSFIYVLIEKLTCFYQSYDNNTSVNFLRINLIADIEFQMIIIYLSH